MTDAQQRAAAKKFVKDLKLFLPRYLKVPTTIIVVFEEIYFE